MTKINDVVKGQVITITGDFNIKSDLTKPKQGEAKPYFRASVDDKSAKMYFMVWNDSPLYETLKGFSDGDRVEIEATVEKEISGTNQYVSGFMNSIKKLEHIGVRQVVNQKGLTDELRKALKDMKHEGISQLIKNIFGRKDIKELFFTSPNSEKTGYSFESGTLAHVVRIIRLSKSVAEVYNNWDYNVDGYQTKLNIDLLVACSILHDIGKVKALSFDGNKIIKTKEGELFEDSYIGAKILIEELQKVELADEDRILLEHAVTSAKSTLGYGSLNVPRTPEAMAFHYVDAMDIKMAHFEFLNRTSASGEEFVRLIDKVFYLGTFDEA